MALISPTIEDARLKEILKLAIVEVLEERQDLVREVLSSALEEIVLTRAINEGLASPPVSREAVFSVDVS